AVAAPAAAALQGEADEARLGVGHVDVVPAAVTGRRPVGRAPRRAVARHLHLEGHRVVVGVPVDHQPAVFSVPAEVDHRPLLARERRALPGGGAVLVEHEWRLVAGKERRGLGLGRHAVLSRRLARLEAEVADPDRAAAALPRRDRELDGAHLLRLAAAGRTPREVQARLADGHPLPLPRKDAVALVAPPDVLAARVDELELEVVGPRLAPQPERERVVLGKRERDTLADDDPTDD